MSATTQTQLILHWQVGQNWFNKPLGFIPVESGDLYVHFQ